MARSTKLVIVSNRGPYRVVNRGAAGRKRVRAAGGLVTALDPMLRARGGVWVSAQETDDPIVKTAGQDDLGYQLAEVALTKRVQAEFYEGISNAVLWPMLHSMAPTVRVGSAPWDSYEAANRAFADAALEAAPPNARFWLHDYHLMLLPRLLRERRKRARIGWFCHVPWPGPDLLATLPWARALIDGLLGADLLGFHTERFGKNFLNCVADLTDCAIDWERGIVRDGDRETRVFTAPIGVPYGEIQTTATSPEVLARMQQIRDAVAGRTMVLGVDRLDYTKGIPERLLAFEEMLRTDRAARQRVVFVQVMVPSREAVDAYRTLKDEIDRMVGDINGRYSVTGRLPVHYYFRNLDTVDLYAHYRAADVALITPLRDGMNLVAHEYCASRVDAGGVLVLSRFAGSACYLDGALLVNPSDLGGTADALRRAVAMDRAEQNERMAKNRAAVHKLDVHRWADRFLKALEGGEA